MNSLINLDPDVIAKILAPVFSLFVGAVIKYYSEARSKVIFFIGHVAAFKLADEAKTSVFTHSVVITNVGRKSAQNVRVSHNLFPQNIAISPSIRYLYEHNENETTDILIPNLVPKEQVTISYLYFPPTVWNQVISTIKSDDGFAQSIQIIPKPQSNKSLEILRIVLTIVGISYLAYWVIRLIIYLLTL